MRFFIIPLLVMVVTQGIKMLIEASKGTFEWSHVNGYGGMPSSHVALATSLSYTIAYFEGLASPAFAVSLILLVILLRDATGYRYQLGIHGRILNGLIKELPDRKEYKYPILSERIGHTPAEVTVGVIAGAMLSAAIIALWHAV
ncbi:MAG: hypothetical protein A3B31_00875 [Candidatus Komeilibacteria bacterium RIFCSPLOWO2_01_FULL_53_11]|uniref:Acid phosphatase n=1 Tax=Candidatus Komeilibacteria bacterium RIFCSPLOWO2_01_FULL_53_11 TaxID=1798552 RepID=A0A1G2BUW0_9BACT|nr:MAG: hypothetical protein A3B31_00875 [Candidatus Komeilibacteria bacterium RIFCSPLOWO2_01_FULL_53_11]